MSTDTLNGAAARPARGTRRRRSSPARRWRPRIADAVFASAPYHWLLGAGPRRILRGTPLDPIAGSAEAATAMFQGRFSAAGHTVQAFNRPPWDAAAAAAVLAADLHGFEWLRDFHAADGPAARKNARDLVRTWWSRFGRWDELAWRPDVAARRLSAWISHAEFLLAGADDEFAANFRSLLTRHVRHLFRAVRFAPPGDASLVAAAGLAIAGLYFRGGRRSVRRAFEVLGREVDRQILADGNHVSRDPASLYRSLRALTLLRAHLMATQSEVPALVQNAIDRMAPMLRFLCHGDGGLALFNGAAEEDARSIKAVLALSTTKAKPPANAPYGGFERLAAERTLVVIDSAGVFAPPPFDSNARAAALAFEMSVGKQRLVVNCGSYSGRDEAWATASLATAAHSTLTIGDRNGEAVALTGGRLDGGVLHGEEEDGHWMEARNESYARAFGLIHHRRFHLANDGQELIGEDRLSRAPHAAAAKRGRKPRGPADVPFTVRFHLHPSVKASLVADGSEILMRLPGGIGWTFAADTESVSLEESVYMGRPGEIRRTEQIVLTGHTRGLNAVVTWRFARLTSAGPY
jgi:uncharacterized heparinase superfamily protein